MTLGLFLYLALVFSCGIVVGVCIRNLIILRQMKGTLFFSVNENDDLNFVLGVNDSVDKLKKLDGKFVILDVKKVENSGRE